MRGAPVEGKVERSAQPGVPREEAAKKAGPAGGRGPA